jgi:ribosome-associated protein
METEKISINTEFIKLDQFLKWAGVFSSGTDAKMMILSGNVKVNGEKEIRRGKKLRKGDTVEVDGTTYEIV